MNLSLVVIGIRIDPDHIFSATDESRERNRNEETGGSSWQTTQMRLSGRSNGDGYGSGDLGQLRKWV